MNETNRSCGNCFFGPIKDFQAAPCWNCKLDTRQGLEAAYNPVKWVTDSDDFWKDTQKEKMTESYQRDALRSENLKTVEWPFPAEANAVPDPKYDVVERPSHYMLFPEKGLEVRDVVNRLLERMEKSEDYWVTPVDYADYAQLMQYLMRWFDKNGKEDLEKARWYLDRLIENWEDDAEPDA